MKYMGSKSRFAKHIGSILSSAAASTCYVEPFGGGMNMISNVTAPMRIANDINKDLIELFKALNAGWRPKSYYTKDEYDWFKGNNGSPHERAWLGICCSYSGKWFGGFAGKVKTKEGLRNYQQEAIDNVLKQLESLKGVIFTCGDYRLTPIPAGSVVYCDPPYADTTGYSGANTSFDSSGFWDWVRDISKNNTVFVSEYKAPPDFTCVWQQETKSSLSVTKNGQESKRSIERLFTI